MIISFHDFFFFTIPKCVNIQWPKIDRAPLPYKLIMKDFTLVNHHISANNLVPLKHSRVHHLHVERLENGKHRMAKT